MNVSIYLSIYMHAVVECPFRVRLWLNQNSGGLQRMGRTPTPYPWLVLLPTKVLHCGERKCLLLWPWP